jgi:AcrR family transcriptional regulator
MYIIWYMAVPNKHQTKTEATRRKLFEAAQSIFARDGFEAARIEDIAAAVGYTRGAFYAHFRTKEDLFLALLEDRANHQIAELRALLETGKSTKERLAQLRGYYVSRLRNKQWTLLILEWKLFALRHPELRAKLAGAHRRIRKSLYLEALRDLLAPLSCAEPAQTEVRKVILEALLNGLVLERAYDPTRISNPQTAAALEKLFDLVVQNF